MLGTPNASRSQSGNPVTRPRHRTGQAGRRRPVNTDIAPLALLALHSMIQVDRHMLLTGRRQIGTSMYMTKVSRVSVCTHVACSPAAGRIGPPRSEKPPRSCLRPPESTLVGVHLDARWSKSSDLAEGQSSIRGRPNRGGVRLGTREARRRGPSAPPPGLGELARRGGRKRKRVRMRLARQLRVAQSERPGGGERLREQRQQRLASATQDVP